MDIIKDDGVHRFVRFRRPESITYWFDLITWPGHLCISGDCGTYVFSRLQDMFEFFRNEEGKPLGINPGYWGEKLKSIGTNAGYREFDEERFRERVTDHFNGYWEDTDYPEAKKECWEEIKDTVLSAACDGEHYAYHAVHDFYFRYGGEMKKRFQFDDFFDGGGTKRCTFHYIWCLYAIVWGIREYDRAKAGA